MTQDVPLGNLAAARLWAAARFPYLASGVFGLQPHLAPGIGTVAVDERWRLWADAEVAAGWTPAQLGSVLVHHVCHLLREHSARAGMAGVGGAVVATGEAAGEVQAADRVAADWVRCADAEINDDLVQAGFEPPGRPVLPGHLGCEPGLLAERYFAAMRDRWPGATPSSGPSSPVGPSSPSSPAGEARRSGPVGEAGPEWNLDCGSGADGCPRPWEGKGSAGLPPWQARLLRRQIALDVTRHMREAGDVPGGLLRWAQDMLEPAVDWRRALSAELRKALADTLGAVDYSYRRPSRRATVAGDVVLPSLRRPVPQVAVVCDTSGSMTEELLAAALAEVDGLLRALGLARQLRVIACDAAAAAAQRVTSARQVELAGGGGTNMGAGIEAASALRPRPAVTVVLTDGFTPWPDSPPRGMRVVVGLLGGEAPDAPGWARAIRVPSPAQ